MKDIVLCSDEGLAVRLGDGPVMSLPWSEVHRVHAYRLDAVQSQPVVLGVEDDGGNTVEIHDSAEGWPDLIARLASLAGFSPEDMAARIGKLTARGPHEILFSAPGR
jgi:hypothetical protein